MLTKTLPLTALLNKLLGSLGQFALHTLLPAAVLLLAGACFIRLVMALVGRLLGRSKLEKAAHTLIRTAVRTVLYILLGLTVASALGIDVTGVIALASVLTLAISLSVQNALTNVISGFTLLYTKPFSSGDYVEVAGQAGSVQEIGLTYTKLATPDNKSVSIPNGAVVSAQIVNYTVQGTRRVDIPLAASYESAPDRVLEALRQAGAVPGILEDKGIFAAVDSYGDSAVNYVLRVWTATDDFWPVKYAILERLPAVLAEAGVEMTYPHLNVHIQK